MVLVRILILLPIPTLLRILILIIILIILLPILLLVLVLGYPPAMLRIDKFLTGVKRLVVPAKRRVPGRPRKVE